MTQKWYASANEAVTENDKDFAFEYERDSEDEDEADEAEAVAEEHAHQDWHDDAWSGDTCEVWVLAPSGKTYHFLVRAEFSPSFTASKFETCPACEGSGKPLHPPPFAKDKMRDLYMKGPHCWRCDGAGEIA